MQIILLILLMVGRLSVWVQADFFLEELPLTISKQNGCSTTVNIASSHLMLAWLPNHSEYSKLLFSANKSLER